MRNVVFGVLSIVFFALLWTPLPVFAEGVESLAEDTGETSHGAVARGTAEKTDPSQMGEPSEKAKACIERRRQKHLLDGPHPWVPSLLWDVPVPDVLPGPHGPPTPPMSLDKRGANPLTLFKNIDILDNSNVSMYGLANVVEPTTVMVGNQVFYSANWVAAESTDGGDSFVYINPYSGPFADPHPQEDFCCDQTSAYDPSTNTVFWLQQYINVVNNTTGTQRINVDQDADGTWDCHYDITAQDMGWGTSRWLDFPDLVVSSNYLWHTSNVFTSTNVFDGSLAVRYPLSELATCAGTLNFDRYTHAGLFSFRLARGATTTGYFAAHAAQTAFMIFQWPDANAVPTQKVAQTAWWQWTGTRSCPGWDGRDWCGRHDSRIQSGYVADGVVGFMWVPVQGGSFPFPYTRVARYNEADMSHIDDIDIWSEDVAYVYPAVAVNSRGDLGGTIMWGGGDTYANNCSVFIADDENGGVLAPLEMELSIQGSYGPLSNEGGDYTMVRVASPDSTKFVGACFANENILRGNPMFVYFGREVTLEPHIFSDGFEIGNTSAWN